MESVITDSETLTSEEMSTLDIIMDETPNPIAKPTNIGDVQPKNVLLVTANIQASFNNSPNRKQIKDKKETTLSSKENMTGDDKKAG